MTGSFEIYIKKPKPGEVHIPAPVKSYDMPRMPDMKDSERFDYEHVADVELPEQIGKWLFDWWNKADFCEEFIVRCELPV